MLIFLWWFFIGDFGIVIAPEPTVTPPLSDELLQMAQIILNLTENVVQDSKQRVLMLNTIRQDNLLSAPFEVGYLSNVVQEKYRKMVDKYNTSVFMNLRLYPIEHVMYLEEIEHHYFEIDHLVNMAHEIEKKYEIMGGIASDYNVHLTLLKEKKAKEAQEFNINLTDPFPKETKRPRPKLVTQSKHEIDKAKAFIKWYADRQKERKQKARYRGPFPLDYGWDVEGASAKAADVKDILEELSWMTRIKLLAERNLTNLDASTEMPLWFYDTSNATRRVGVEALSARRQIGLDGLTTETNSVDKNMRLKLFRLMYETVRECDIKVKRAEQIQEHYSNITMFQIGYLISDIKDKFNIMTDISNTIERFYAEWKPIEHINAYEQIANQAIEISHLIEMVRLVKKNEKTDST